MNTVSKAHLGYLVGESVKVLSSRHSATYFSNPLQDIRVFELSSHLKILDLPLGHFCLSVKKDNNVMLLEWILKILHMQQQEPLTLGIF